MDNIEDAKQVLKLIARLGIPTADDAKVDYITGFYEDAKSEVLGYCQRDDVIGDMPTAIRQLAKVRYNQEGNEGEASRSEGGISQSFEEGIPKNIRTQLSRYRIARARKLS